MMPKRDGISVLTSLRQDQTGLPILILSAKHTTEEKVFGLDAGADDYLAKPFSFSELLARTHALLRRHKQTPAQHILRFQDLTMDRITRQVMYKDNKIDLQVKEFALLELFMKNPGRALSKTYILDQIWNVNFDPQTNVVDVLVCRLRNKIEKSMNKKFIYTIRGVGYVLKDEK
jgi:DNA-binding response OmpR family regulator